MAIDKFAVPNETVAEPTRLTEQLPSTRHPSNSHTQDDDGFDHIYACKFHEDSGKWGCVPYYKKKILQDVIDENQNQRAIIDQLKDFGYVTTKYIDHCSIFCLR